MTVSYEQWAAVDDYVNNVLVPQDAALKRALETARSAGLPAINVAPNQGKLLHILARLMGARRILEVGTLGGYSSIWLARALPPGGKLITLEIDPRFAELARDNLAGAGLSEQTEVRVGRALQTLPVLQAQGAGPFDLVFIDADKPSNPEYFQWAVELSRPGSLIVVDNVVRNGAVADAASDDPGVQGTRRMNELIAQNPRVLATAIQTVGLKGYDGLALALVLDREDSV